MNENVLVVQGLTKTIKKQTIVNDVSFQVKKGEIFGLLGPNGAGKTTIIRMIASLINRTKGSVTINNHDLDHDFEGAMNDLGAIVENPEFYKYMSGKKNMIHYARMARQPVTRERMDEVAKLVKLDHAIGKKVKTYSLGMRQRLGVAQAILHRPALLILDEPTNGLDPQGIREFRDYLRELVNEGTGVLISSHLLSEMQLLCDSYAVIEKGKLIHIEGMNTMGQIEQDDKIQEVVMSVNSPTDAAELITKQFEHIPVVAKELTITIHAIKQDVALVNRLLAGAGVDVYEIAIVKKSLEDRFFEITEHEEVHQ